MDVAEMKVCMEGLFVVKGCWVWARGRIDDAQAHGESGA